VRSTRTTIVLETVKEDPRLPLPSPAPAPEGAVELHAEDPVGVAP
jgi:hypothetical protein